MTDDMTGRTVLITGGNTGIGKETAVALAHAGATVVFTARDATRGADALTEIRDRSGSTAVDVMALDLARFASVRDFASRWSGEHDHLDVLVNNAGLVLNQRRETEDGNEMTFQVNHLGPFLLTQLLREQLVAGDAARVVNVASDAHKSARRGLDFDDLQSHPSLPQLRRLLPDEAGQHPVHPRAGAAVGRHRRHRQRGAPGLRRQQLRTRR